MNKVTAIIIGIIILLFGGFVTWSIISSEPKTVDYEQYDYATVIGPNEDNGEIGDHFRGKEGAEVVVVEYGDFQCAGCATTHPKLDTLLEEYGDRVAFVFRNFPINGHQNARAAASAAEAAGLQGYFFEMVSIIYANQATWSYASGTERTSVFLELFQQIAEDGDGEKFVADMSNSNVSKKINFDYDLGYKRNGVTGTPSFFVNGEFVDLSNSSTTSDFLKNMRTRIDSELTAHGLPTGATNTDSEDSATE